MSISVQCPKCGGSVHTEQVNYRRRYVCDHCGGLPYRDGKPETGRGNATEIEYIKPPQAGAA